MDKSAFLTFLCSSTTAISSILAAVVAFMFSARNALRGSGLAELESFYRKIILALIIVFVASVASFLYFSIALLWAEKGNIACDFDYVFILLMLALLPALAVLWTSVYFKHK